MYADGVRLIALRALGERSLADDIAQEAVARAIAVLAEGRGETIGDLRAFIYGIARHLIADAHRARDRTVALDGVAEPPEPRLDALETTIADEERRQVRAALKELPPRDRNILRLCFFEGLDAVAIAARLRESVVTIRKRKSRALERLRRAFFNGHEPPPGPTES